MPHIGINSLQIQKHLREILLKKNRITNCHPTKISVSILILKRYFKGGLLRGKALAVVACHIFYCA